MSQYAADPLPADFSACSDEHLVELSLSAVDTGAFDTLSRRYRQRCFALAVNLLREDEGARDAVQRALFKAWHHLSRFRRESAFSTWLLRILINECRQDLRRGQRRFTESLDSTDIALFEPRILASSVRDPETQVLESQLQVRLRRALLGMPRHYREPILLHYFSGLSASEIAARLDLSIANVKSRLARGRSELRRRIDPQKRTRPVLGADTTPSKYDS